MPIASLQTSAHDSNSPSGLGDSRTQFDDEPESWNAAKAVQHAKWKQDEAAARSTLAVTADVNEVGSLSPSTKGQAMQTAAGLVDGPQKWRDTPPATSLHAIQEWEGYVIAIGNSDFTARLLDVTAGSSIEGEEADIPLSEISETDAEKMKIGSIFRWVIGYERSTCNQSVKRVSLIVFRELPAITRSDEQAGLAWAEKITAAFNR